MRFYKKDSEANNMKRTDPRGPVGGNQMSTDGEGLVKTGTNRTDVQTSRPAVLFSTERIRQTVTLSSKHDAFYSRRFLKIKPLIAKTTVEG